MTTLREYDAKTDSRKRIMMCSVSFENRHDEEYSDGQIVTEQGEPVAPFQVSSDTLSMMDHSVKNMKEGHVSDRIDLSEFKK